MYPDTSLIKINHEHYYVFEAIIEQLLQTKLIYG